MREATALRTQIWADSRGSLPGFWNSTGIAGETLRELIVDGETETPDFQAAHTLARLLPLETKFHARVDATNGDTWLEPVEATLGRFSHVGRGTDCGREGRAGRNWEAE